MSHNVVPTLIMASLILVIPLSFGTTISYSVAGISMDATEAQQAINEAQDAIYSALGHIAEVNLAGAPITDFVTSLNDAIEILTQARAAYNASNFEYATLLAGNAKNAAELVSQQAQTCLTETRINAAIQLLITITILIVVVVITYFLITRWRDQKRKRTQDLLRMEIRLPTQEEEGETSE
jgi:cytochrome bd-type quinol oxidase subunit 2